MHFFTPVFRSLFCAAVVAFGLTFFTTIRAAEVSDPTGPLVDTFTLPAGISAARTQEVILFALKHRLWNVKSSTEGQVVAYLRNRNKEATTTFVYTAEKIDLYCNGWKISKSTGERIKQEQPVRWLKYLREDITKYLGTAGALPVGK